MLTAKIPLSVSTARAAAANSTDVRCAGVRAPANKSAITTSNEPAGSSSSTARASPMRTVTLPARPAGPRGPAGRAARGLPQRQALAHQVDYGGIGINRELARARPGRRRIPRQAQRAAAEVQYPQGLACGRGEVEHVPETLHVLEVEVARIVQVDVRLRRAADQQGPGVRPVRIGEQFDGIGITQPAHGGLAPTSPPVCHDDYCAGLSGWLSHSGRGKPEDVG